MTYNKLTPELRLDCVEAADYRCDGRLLALNSYENRVYRVGLATPLPGGDERRAPDAVVAKFYRSGRWSDSLRAVTPRHER